jgi:phosphoglycolate phosphatase-like HAD superfamily hydrolase
MSFRWRSQRKPNPAVNLAMALRCAVFDFDGTLVDSNPIKVASFYRVVSDFPPARAGLEAVLAGPEPGDRTAIFRALHQTLTEGGVVGLPGPASWIVAYTRLCEDEISDAPEIAGASVALAALRAAGVHCYINSATPEEALRAIIRRRGFSDHFIACLGGPATKVQNLEKIAQHHMLSPDEIAMIGDSEADQRAAEVFGCRFIAIGPDGRRFDYAPAVLLPDLTRLAEVLLPEGGLL